MKIQLVLLLLCFSVTDSFSQANQNERVLTNVHHYRSNISVKNFDGTRSSIDMNGNSATLTNSDGIQSTIDFNKNSSTLIASDGTIIMVSHNSSSSTVNMPDGSQFFVNHMHSTSSCSTVHGKHTIMHFFGDVGERRFKNKIDVLIHVNWLIQNEIIEATIAKVE